MLCQIKKYYLITLLLIAGCSKQPVIEVLPVETFFKNAQQFNYRISPDGKALAFLQLYKGKLNVFVRSIDDTTTLQLTRLEDLSVRDFSWVGNNRLFCEKEKDSSNRCGAFLIGKDGTNYTSIKIKAGKKLNILDNSVHANQVLITSNERDESFFDVYQLNIENGSKKLFVENPGDILLWFADEKGDVNLGAGSDGVNETIYYRANVKEKLKAIFSNNFKSTLKPLGFTKDKRYIYALSNLNRDKLALVEFDCLEGKESKLIYQHPDVDILEVLNSGLNKEPALVTYELDRRQVHFLNQTYKEIYEDILDKLPNREIKITDSSKHNLIIKAYTDKNPGAFYIYNIEQRSLKKLADVNPAIEPANMCSMQAISYQTKDGLTIHGYLTLPLGKKKENLPCVILPHSGPNQRNVWDFLPEVQFLANRGYAVLQMNYRGSTGYGKKFENAGFKQWSAKMQDDISDGVAWLIKEGIANPTQIGIFGYGFGGYAALNQVINHPDTYQCAASYSGYINLFTYIKGYPPYFKPYQLMLNEMIGNPETDVDYLKSASPVFQIEKIKRPILIAQGGKDAKVNVNETNQFVKELRKKNIAVKYILNENETRLFKNIDNKLRFYTELVDFLDQHLKPH